MQKAEQALRRHFAITLPLPIGAANGASRMTREIAAHLAALGNQVTLLSVSCTMHTNFPRPPAEQGVLGYEFDQELAAAGVSVIRVLPHPVSWQLDALMLRRQIKALARKGPLDAVLSYYRELAFLTGFLRRKAIPFGFIATSQSYVMALGEQKKRAFGRAGLHKFWNNILIRSPHRRAAVLFPTSEFSRNEIVTLLGVDRGRTRVCYLGVDPAFLTIQRAPRDTVRNLIFFGRLVPTKGVWDALAALGRLKAEGLTDWRFRMMGTGNHAWVKGLAVKFGIEDQVDVLPAVADIELRNELAHADLALMPSHAESFGLSIAEAHASGLPVVAYAAGSVPEVVANGETGWLVPFRNMKLLAAALSEALTNPAESRRRGDAGRARVAQLFTWENTARTISAGLEEVL